MDELGRIGGWAVHVADRQVQWSGPLSDILDWHEPDPPSLEAILGLYDTAERERVEAERRALVAEFARAHGERAWAYDTGGDGAHIVVQIPTLQA